MTDQYLEVPLKNKKIGLVLLVGGFYVLPVLFIMSLFIFLDIGFSRFGIAGGLGNFNNYYLIRQYIPVLSIIGLFCSLSGIIIFLQKKSAKSLEFDKRSGNGEESEIPPEVAEKKWHWGAAFFSFAWGPYSNVWISLLNFIPFFWIVSGIKGYQWAWRKSRWKSVDSFLKTQRKWETAGIAYFGLMAVFVVVQILMMFSLLNSLQNNLDNSDSFSNDNVPVHSVQSTTSGQNFDWAKIK